jgi:hypothetical protein
MDPATNLQKTLTMHWDGVAWRVVASPNPSTTDQNILQDVSSTSTGGGSYLGSTWAVGYYLDSGGRERTLAMRWDTSQWTVIPSPNVGTDHNTLGGVAGMSSVDVWAVGNYVDPTSSMYHTLTMHWDGLQWSVVSSPSVASVDNYLEDIVVVSAADIWAVGYTVDSNGNQRPLSMHWNGTQWSIIATPNVGAENSRLKSVAAVSASDVWAVGYHEPTQAGYAQTLVEHWDGTQWSVVSSPNAGPYHNYLYGAFADSAGHVLAVGYYLDGTTGMLRTLVEGLDGTQWRVVPSPNIEGIHNILFGVTVLPSGDLWAVGQDYNSVTGGQRTLIERFDTHGCTPSPTATPSPSLTPTDTATLTVTPTATATATAGSQAYLSGHVTWQGRPAQPHALQQMPITLTLRSSTIEVNYPAQNTDASGFFTVPVSTMPSGAYNWRVKGPKFLANAGTVTLSGAASTQQEMGLLRTGDADGDNRVTATDFIILKNTFGKGQGDPGYDDRADFNGDQVVTSGDFTLLKATFGMGGAPPIGPALP